MLQALVATSSESDRAHPAMIGPYRIRERLGEGGMGEVFLASQDRPIRRKVALKVIRAGSNQDVLERFRYERDILARLEHPSIAKIFDAGTSDDGRPYFAMEYVSGPTITAFCDSERLTVEKRLEIFRIVCDAVQHAHHKGVIHRDIKPSNVLTTLVDGKPIPKIIDFGIARALEGHGALALLKRTRHGVVVGTPEYMSPEQTTQARHEVDMRTDVYSLGVLLHELLIGTVPFRMPQSEGSSLEDLFRAIRDDEPARPSDRLGRQADDAANVARARGVEITALVRTLRHELDWIVLQALRKDPERRYASPRDLSADIGRFLQGEPVIARPPSATYRATKFVRRHRAAVGLAASAVVFLVILSVVTTIQAARIGREKERADREAKAATDTSDFLMGLFQVSDPTSDPTGGEGGSITARELLKRGARNVRDHLAEQPIAKARMMDTIGMVYRSLGLYDDALPLLQESFETLKKADPEHDIDVARSQLHLGLAFRDLGQFDKADTQIRASLAARREFRGDRSKEKGEALYELGRLLYDQGKYPESVEALQQALGLQEAALGKEDKDVSKTVNALAMVYDTQGKPAEAETLYLRAIAIDDKTLPPDSPMRVETLNNLAELYRVQQRFTDAERLYKESLSILQRTLDADHPNLATIYNNLGLLYRAQKRYPEAEQSYERCREILIKHLPPGHPYIATSTNNLAVLKLMEGKLDEAEPLYKEALALRRAALPAGHSDIAESVFNLALLYDARKDYARAEPLFEESLKMRVVALGPKHPLVQKTVDRYADMLKRSGQLKDAEALLAAHRP
jgi:serine/threonine protein kinase/tetratricopeptide (TPR) repeat protein